MIYSLLLEINIQFGNFKSYSSGNSNSIKDWLPVIGMIVTVGLFYLKYRIDEQKEKQKEQKRLIPIRDYFFICLNMYLKTLKQQIKMFEEVINEIETDIKPESTNSQFRAIKYNVNSNPVLLLEIDKKDTYKFFTSEEKDNKKERKELYAKFYLSLNLMSFNEKQILEHFSSSVGRNNILREKIDAGKDELSKLMQDLNLQSMTDIADSNIKLFFSQLSQIYKSYFEAVKKENYLSIELLMIYLIKPIQDKCLKFLEIPQTQSLAKDFIRLCNEIMIAYAEMFHNKKLDLENFKNWKSNFNLTKNIIEKMKEIEFQDLDDKEHIFIESKP